MKSLGQLWDQSSSETIYTINSVRGKTPWGTPPLLEMLIKWDKNMYYGAMLNPDRESELGTSCALLVLQRVLLGLCSQAPSAMHVDPCCLSSGPLCWVLCMYVDLDNKSLALSTCPCLVHTKCIWGTLIGKIILWRNNKYFSWKYHNYFPCQLNTVQDESPSHIRMSLIAGDIFNPQGLPEANLKYKFNDAFFLYARHSYIQTIPNILIVLMQSPARTILEMPMQSVDLQVMFLIENTYYRTSYRPIHISGLEDCLGNFLSKI